MPSSRDFVRALRLLHEETDRAIAWRLVCTIALVVAGGLLAGFAPLALKGLVDAVTGAPQGAARTGATTIMATTFGVAYLAALCGGRLLIECRPSLLGAAEQRLYAQLRQRYFAHLLRVRLAFHLAQPTGALVHGLQQAITGYQILVFSLVNSVVPVVVECATMTGVLVSLGQPALTATFAATALAYLAVLTLCPFDLKGAARALSQASLETHGVLADGLLNVEAIKCFNAEETTRRRLAESCGLLGRRWRRLYRERTRLGLALTATFALSTSAMLAIAVHATLNGALGVGGFVLTNVYILQVMRPLEMLGSAVRDLSQALEYIRPLLDVLEQAPEPSAAVPVAERGVEGIAASASRPRAGVERQGPPCIRFRDVHFRYDDAKPVLQGLDLDIAAGSTVAIVGSSGSGKSSLARLLLRLYEPQRGRVWLDSTPIDALPVDDLRACIGFVPQDLVLFNDTIGFNIGLGKAGASRCDIERAARLARLHDLISSLPEGYDTRVGERGLRLSGGERQRMAIARAVLKRPRIYVLDEATSMLDSRTEHAILRHLRESAAGCTTITIAHRLSAVRDADDIVVLEAGQVAERGSHATLLAKNGSYAALWRAQRGRTE